MLTLQPNMIFAERYTLVERIGQGGFSEVWKVKRASGFEQALKIFITLDQEGLTSAQNEFEKMFNLNHQRILTATDFGVWEKYPYLAMPYCKHGSAIKKIGKLTEEELMKVLADIASALTYLHGLKNSVIHQDIKPDNFLIDNDGHYLLSDFGISRHIKKRLSIQLPASRMTQTMNGDGVEITGFAPPSYRPPEAFSKELAQRKPVKASDVWALGTTLFEMATEELPFGELGGAIQNTGIETPNLPKENFSPEFNQLLHWCLEKQTWDRPTAEQLQSIAEHYLKTGKYQGLPKIAVVAPVSVSPPRSKKRNNQVTIGQGIAAVGHQPALTQVERKKTNWLLPFLLCTILLIGGFGYYAITTLINSNRTIEAGQSEGNQDESNSDETKKSENTRPITLLNNTTSVEEVPEDERISEDIEENLPAVEEENKIPMRSSDVSASRETNTTRNNITPPTANEDNSSNRSNTEQGNSTSLSDELREKEAVELQPPPTSTTRSTSSSNSERRSIDSTPNEEEDIPAVSEGSSEPEAKPEIKEEAPGSLDIKTSNRIRNGKMKIKLRSNQNINAGTIQKGDEVKFTVSSDTRMHNYLLIRKGTPLTGVVSVASKSKKGIAIKFKSIKLATGDWVKLRAVVLKNQKSNASFEEGKTYDLSFKIRAEKELDKYIGRLARK